MKRERDPEMLNGVGNPHVLITGGSSGIGRALAKLMARKGASISIVSRDPLKLGHARQEIEASRKKAEQKVLAFAADVSDRDQVRNAVSAAIQELGPPEVVITSAGIALPGYFMELPIEVFERSMAVNYFGTLHTIRAALPFMVDRRRGHLVLISSGAGLTGVFGYTAYSPSKFALRGLAESLRGELRAVGITVSIVYPPDTDTPQLEEENKIKPPETKRITGTMRTWGTEEVAHVILRGIERKSFMITPGMGIGLLARFHSLISPLTRRYLDHLAAKARRESGPGR